MQLVSRCSELAEARAALDRLAIALARGWKGVFAARCELAEARAALDQAQASAPVPWRRVGR